jgi:hypothetical protein
VSRRSGVIAQALALGAVGAALLAPVAALAFKAGADFQKPAASGGGSGLLFTGAPAYRRWNCTICHEKAPGQIRIGMDVEPRSLLDQRAYEPGRAYTVTLSLTGQHRGDSSALNTNGFALTIADASGAPAGSLSGYDANELGPGNNDAEIVTTGLFEKRTSWRFVWTAPPLGTGPVSFYVGMVDGDGASRTDVRTSDPLNDDVAVGEIRFRER